MALFHNVVSIMILQDNYWYKQSWSKINSFKPEQINNNTIKLWSLYFGDQLTKHSSELIIHMLDTTAA